MGDNKFFNNNRKRFNHYNEPRHEVKENQLVENKDIKEIQLVENKDVKENLTTTQEERVSVLDKSNYLALDKKPEEKLVSNGVVFKHGSVAKCNILNFREEPSKEAKIIHTFSAGEEILYTETNDPDWFEVKDKDGVIGYCMSDFIKIEI